MKKTTLCMVFLGVLICRPGYACAELYQWVDKNGVVHYSNSMVADENSNINEGKGIQIMGEKMASQDPDPDLKMTTDESAETAAYKKEEIPAEQTGPIEKEQAESDEALRESLKAEIAHFHREIKNDEEKLELTKVELEHAQARYDEIKREGYSSTEDHRKRLQGALSRKMRHENRIETIKRSIQDYKDLIGVNEKKLAQMSN